MAKRIKATAKPKLNIRWTDVEEWRRWKEALHAVGRSESVVIRQLCAAYVRSVRDHVMLDPPLVVSGTKATPKLNHSAQH